MKRDYPIFIIDRDEVGEPPCQYISCVDDTTPFIIKVRACDELPENHAELYEYVKGVLFEVVKIADDYDKTRAKSLLKKAIKKFLLIFDTNNYKGKDDLSLDSQIYQQELTISRAKKNYRELLARAGGNKSLAIYNIRLAEATLESLKELQTIKKN